MPAGRHKGAVAVGRRCSREAPARRGRAEIPHRKPIRGVERAARAAEGFTNVDIAAVAISVRFASSADDPRCDNLQASAGRRCVQIVCKAIVLPALQIVK